MSFVLDLPFMDLNCAAESVTMNAGLTFSGAIDPLQVEEARARIATAWPTLGAYIRQNKEVNET
jgi:flagellar biosynthesis protein FliR